MTGDEHNRKGLLGQKFGCFQTIHHGHVQIDKRQVNLRICVLAAGPARTLGNLG
jgi:hypothetical protein